MNWYVQLEIDKDIYIFTVSGTTKESVIKRMQRIYKGCHIREAVPVAGHHLCKYCHGIAEGTDEDILCDECRETFGHTFYFEL